MKKINLFCTGLLFTIISYSTNAQINTRTGGAGNVLANSPTTNTNVGIGTNTPKSKLDIEGNLSIGVNYSGATVAPINGAIIEGNVGIGTDTPLEKLEVVGSVKATRGVFNSNQLNGQIYQSNLFRNDECIALSAGSIVGVGVGYKNTRMLNFYDFVGPTANSNIGSTLFFGLEDRNNVGRFRMIATTGQSTLMSMLNKSQQETFKVYDDGSDNVSMTLPKPNSFLGIGTTSFVDGANTYRLSVKGKIRAEEIKVYNTWADYVFSDRYKLPTLSEVESFIKLNGHLQNVPSAKEVEKNGLLLGEMSKIQQEKIEELTLYLIQQNKQIEELILQVNMLIKKKN